MATSWGVTALLGAAKNPQIQLSREALEIVQIEQAKAERKGKNKFGAVRVTTPEGLKFASKAEYAHYGELRYRELAKEITDLTTHPVLELHAGVRYIADFKYREIATGKIFIVDVKGGKATQTQSFKDKWKQAIEKFPEFCFVKVVVERKKRGQRGRK